jgi:chromosome segregation ATPase
MQSMAFDLETARRENEVLACTVEQQKAQATSEVSKQENDTRTDDASQVPQNEIDLQSRLESVLANLADEQERVSQMETTVKIREEDIYKLQTQLDQALERISRDAEDAETLESVRQQLAAETLRTSELTSILETQEEIISSLQSEIEAERDRYARDAARQGERITELEVAYRDQVTANHDQYMELEEAMDEREAKFSDRIAELESESDKYKREIAAVQETINRLRSTESQIDMLQQGLDNTRALLAERERQVDQMTEKIELQSQQYRQQDDAMAALKRQAADDVFRSTKQERRIEKLLHDREMLNIAVEQLQIHIQLVSGMRESFHSTLADSNTGLAGETPIQSENWDILGRRYRLSTFRQSADEFGWTPARPQHDDSAGQLEIDQLFGGAVEGSQQAMTK